MRPQTYFRLSLVSAEKYFSVETSDNWKYICAHMLTECTQGCALRNITRSPKVPDYEIHGAQHKAYMKEIRLSGSPKAKVSRLRHPGTLRAQPWYMSLHRKQLGLAPFSSKTRKQKKRVIWQLYKCMPIISCNHFISVIKNYAMLDS